MKIYISGPITGTEDYRRRFAKAENALRAAGHEVINPTRVNAELPEGTTYQEYMKMSMCMLDMCDTVFLMDGWEKSRGCNAETAYALKKGITIVQEGRYEKHLTR